MPVPQPKSLIDIVLKNIAIDWEFHRVYNQYYLYFLPNHLKPALIRYVGLASEGASLADLKIILLPPAHAYDDYEDEPEGFNSQPNSNSEMTCLDLSASIGRSLKLKDLSSLLFSDMDGMGDDEPQDSWDTVDVDLGRPSSLLPNLTHLSLALDPGSARDASWKQLIGLSSKLSTVTHLSLAYWPVPSLTPRAHFATVFSPQGRNIPYGGTNYYSHSIDQDWSEALLVLRMLSNNMYKLEFLDLTGCATWFQALRMRADHDYVDWAGSWGKMTVLRLRTGWEPGAEAQSSEKAAYSQAIDTASSVEKHITAMRAGKGRFITVERDSVDL